MPQQHTGRLQQTSTIRPHCIGERSVSNENMNWKETRIYEMVVRHFLKRIIRLYIIFNLLHWSQDQHLPSMNQRVTQ